jgi:hypothetical protein
MVGSPIFEGLTSEQINVRAQFLAKQHESGVLFHQNKLAGQIVYAEWDKKSSVGRYLGHHYHKTTDGDVIVNSFPISETYQTLKLKGIETRGSNPMRVQLERGGIGNSPRINRMFDTYQYENRAKNQTEPLLLEKIYEFPGRLRASLTHQITIGFNRQGDISFKLVDREESDWKKEIDIAQITVSNPGGSIGIGKPPKYVPVDVVIDETNPYQFSVYYSNGQYRTFRFDEEAKENKISQLGTVEFRAGELQQMRGQVEVFPAKGTTVTDGSPIVSLGGRRKARSQKSSGDASNAEIQGSSYRKSSSALSDSVPETGADQTGAF